jgi:hypothetical protein
MGRRTRCPVVPGVIRSTDSLLSFDTMLISRSIRAYISL